MNGLNFSFHNFLLFFVHEDVRVDNYVVSHEVLHVCISVWCRGMSGRVISVRQLDQHRC